MPPDAEKVLIYARRGSRILVFDEPDFPAVPLQVPGGTIEHGESAINAAKREFHEETGLLPNKNWSEHGSADYNFSKNGKTVSHRRHIFTVLLEDKTPEFWFHDEKHSSDGHCSIRFRLFFLEWKEATRSLGFGMEIPLSWPIFRAFFA
nr:NUDIX hydrolase [Marinicella sp. W31]MDC2878831.1 NUDIX hydrolase [Marinicella sp. W31]